MKKIITALVLPFVFLGELHAQDWEWGGATFTLNNSGGFTWDSGFNADLIVSGGTIILNDSTLVSSGGAGSCVLMTGNTSLAGLLMNGTTTQSSASLVNSGIYFLATEAINNGALGAGSLIIGTADVLGESSVIMNNYMCINTTFAESQTMQINTSVNLVGPNITINGLGSVYNYSVRSTAELNGNFVSDNWIILSDIQGLDLDRLSFLENGNGELILSYASIPEPSTTALILSALAVLGMVFLRRPRKRRKGQAQHDLL